MNKYRVTEEWVQIDTSTLNSFTVQFIGHNNTYMELFIGANNPMQNDNGMAIQPFERLNVKPTQHIYARSKQRGGYIVVTDIIATNQSLSGDSGADIALIKEDVDLIKPMFTDLCCGQVQNFMSGVANREAILYKDETGVYYCNYPNEDTKIDPSSRNWIDFGIMNGFDLLQKRGQYIFELDKVSPTDNYYTVDNLLPIGDTSALHAPLPTTSLDGFVFKILFKGENLDVISGSPIHIAFLDKYGQVIGEPLVLKHVEGNFGGYVNFEGRLLTGSIISIVKPFGKNHFVYIG